MKKLIFILLAVLSLFIFRIAHAYIQDLNVIKEQERLEMAQIEAEMARVEYINSLSVPELIGYISPQYSHVLTKIAKCESGLKPHAINYNDGGSGKHSVGILQFQESTFNYYSGLMKMDLDYYSSHDQILVATFMLDRRRAVEWTCFKIVGSPNY